MMTDPISDMLSRIRNASLARKHTVDIPLSKMKFSIAKILEKEDYLENVGIKKDALKPTLQVTLKYDSDGKKSTISSLTRVSKPGRRIYTKADEIIPIRSGFGFAILSTPNGIMTSKEAKKRRLGGEVICEIY